MSSSDSGEYGYQYAPANPSEPILDRSAYSQDQYSHISGPDHYTPTFLQWFSENNTVLPRSANIANGPVAVPGAFADLIAGERGEAIRHIRNGYDLLGDFIQIKLRNQPVTDDWKTLYDDYRAPSDQRSAQQNNARIQNLATRYGITFGNYVDWVYNNQFPGEDIPDIPTPSSSPTPPNAPVNPSDPNLPVADIERWQPYLNPNLFYPNGGYDRRKRRRRRVFPYPRRRLHPSLEE